VAAGSTRVARSARFDAGSLFMTAGNDGMTSRYLGVLAVWVAVLVALYALQQYFS
jgi:hypothetical protein